MSLYASLSRVLPALAAVALLAGAATVPTAVAQEKPFTAAEESAIRDLVREYILEHPEIILEAIRELERREKTLAERSRQDAIVENWDLLANDPASPVIGNPDGDVVLIEFFDYNCGYCRRMTVDVFDLVEADGKIRFVLKELPIFGEGSRFAAKAALASAKQGLYEEFHYALMTAGLTIDPATTMAIAAAIGLDVQRLERDMLDPALDRHLEDNYRLARALNVEGTPATVIGQTFVPGARGYDELAAIVAASRRAN